MEQAMLKEILAKRIKDDVFDFGKVRNNEC